MHVVETTNQYTYYIENCTRMQASRQGTSTSELRLRSEAIKDPLEIMRDYCRYTLEGRKVYIT